eukprot:1705101-Rhodomonas_salina.1
MLLPERDIDDARYGSIATRSFLDPQTSDLLPTSPPKQPQAPCSTDLCYPTTHLLCHVRYWQMLSYYAFAVPYSVLTGILYCSDHPVCTGAPAETYCDGSDDSGTTRLSPYTTQHRISKEKSFL